MPYRTILLNLNDEDRAGELIRAALAVAANEKAHIIGLYAIPSALPPPELIGPVANTWIEEQMRVFRDQARRIKANFEQAMKNSEVTHEWRLDESRYDETVADSIIAYARTADLVIVSRAPENGWIDDVPERVTIECGRPVLVLPQEGEFEHLGSNVTVAWKPSKEATRAVFDALPLLQKAKHVQLLSIREHQDSGERSNADSISELAANLQRHGIEARTDVAPRGQSSVGDSLVEFVNSGGQDLLVMGIYGHSRFRELLLGGASRGVLQHMTIPVLFSH